MFAAAVSNDTELFKCCDGNDMKEIGYSCFFFGEIKKTMKILSH